MANASTILVDHYAPTADVNGLRSNLPPSEYGQQAADDFRLLKPSSLTSVAWTGFYWLGKTPSASVDFTIRIYLGNEIPTSVVSSQRVTAKTTHILNDDFFDWPLFDFSAEFSEPIVLAPFKTYWLSIMESDSATPEWDFCWMEVPTRYQYGLGAYRYWEGDYWDLTGFDASFALSGVEVPELAAAQLALAAILLLTRRLDRGRSRPLAAQRS